MASNKTIPFDYYYGTEANQYAFYRLPKALFANERFRCLSDGAKVLYGLMLDRMALSIKNGWLDERNRAYIIYTLDEVQEHMFCSRDRGIKMLCELDITKGVGLIERIRRGQGRPSIIYLRKFFETGEVLKSEKSTSRSRKTRLQEVGKPDFKKSEKPTSINRNMNKTDYSYTDSTNPSTYLLQTPAQTPSQMDGRMEEERRRAREQIEYTVLSEEYGKDKLDNIVEIMAEIACCHSGTRRIEKCDYDISVVKARLAELRPSHIQYVMNCFRSNRRRVTNIKAYLLTMLFNASATMTSHYENDYISRFDDK